MSASALQTAGAVPPQSKPWRLHNSSIQPHAVDFFIHQQTWKSPRTPVPVSTQYPPCSKALWSFHDASLLILSSLSSFDSGPCFASSRCLSEINQFIDFEYQFPQVLSADFFGQSILAHHFLEWATVDDTQIGRRIQVQILWPLHLEVPYRRGSQ